MGDLSDVNCRCLLAYTVYNLAILIVISVYLCMALVPSDVMLKQKMQCMIILSKYGCAMIIHNRTMSNCPHEA